MMLRTLNNTQHIAKKDHRCFMCQCKIEKGTLYHKQTNVYDDNIYDVKMHQACYSLLGNKKFFEDDGDGITSNNFCNLVEELTEENKNNLTLKERSEYLLQKINNKK